ncbi:hypothetical protein PMI07_002734 [Rhizobium sp. CF080]|uniref:hypothetical protein n=1 Tax=Rhizobium sp. (strain CF080) TaxID=1144310 RepID=UPI000271D701|nr:hypothetical protein [Rhizobium sp. CF080]EUB94956.1 hypothetical protein PMI07_002734 [Rhizobium sp. CF080]
MAGIVIDASVAAAYLELSMRLDLSLATFDKALAAAAARNGKLAHHTPLKP